MGNEKLSNIMRNAIEIYEKNKGLLEKYNDGTLESFSESYSENLIVMFHCDSNPTFFMSFTYIFVCFSNLL